MSVQSRVFVFLMTWTIASAALAQERSWADRVRVSGSADLGFFGGGTESVAPSDGFDLWDARLFVDAELGESLELGDTLAVRNLGFTLEWNLVRNGRVQNDVGLAYLDLEGLGGSSWWNLRAGRFQIPFGEAYKLYSKGYAQRNFVQQPLGGPWWWDEGALIHGAATSGRLGYLASLTNGDTGFNDLGDGLQFTLKLWAQPFDCLYLSASGLWSNELGMVDGALWLGEGWARSFGSGGPPLANVVDGVAVPDDPDGLGNTWALGLDIVVTPTDGVRVWLAGAYYDVESRGASIYDRGLAYWLAELLVDGELFSPALHPLFLGVRADGVGTWDSGRGYLLDVRYTADFGYNMEHFIAYTAIVGWQLSQYVKLRAEYSHRDVELVRGAAALLPGRTGNEDVFSIEFGIHF